MNAYQRTVLAIHIDIATAKNAHRAMRNALGIALLHTALLKERDGALAAARRRRRVLETSRTRDILLVGPGIAPDTVLTLNPGIWLLRVQLPHLAEPVDYRWSGKRTPDRCEIWAPVPYTAPQGAIGAGAGKGARVSSERLVELTRAEAVLRRMLGETL